MALLALDTRLAGVVRSSREPLLGQLRLAWWRDRLGGDPAQWPAGEPLLACLRDWPGELPALVALVDGWEAMTGEPPLAAEAMEELARARAKAFGSLAEGLGLPEERATAERLAMGWALVDILSGLSSSDEQERARALAQRHDWRRQRLAAKLRPLVVLHGLAARSLRTGQDLHRLSPAALLPAMRLGLLGR